MPADIDALTATVEVRAMRVTVADKDVLRALREQRLAHNELAEAVRALAVANLERVRADKETP
jgi:hypothetical protein